MVALKIQCGCGQLYEFEVEPVEGRMPGPVTCPTCGADGTEAGNTALSQSRPPAAPPTGGARLRVSVTPHSNDAARAAARRAAPLLPGQVDRTQAKFEARAKVSWGDSSREVLSYLMGQGYNHAEASELVDEMFRERAAVVRCNGIKNILCGAGLILVPIVAFFIFMGLGYILVKTFIITIIVGFVGVWLVIKGVGMVVSPKSEEGDVAQQ